MNRVSLLLVASLVACGGSKPNQKNLAPLPPDKPVEEAKKEEPAPKPEVKPEPPKPMPPLEVAVEPPTSTVKLVRAGKGKKTKLKYAVKPGAKQSIEMALSLSQFAKLGDQSRADVVPTIILKGDAETKAVDASGKADYTFTMSGTDAREEPGANGQGDIDEFKVKIASLGGLVITGSVDAAGVMGGTKMRIEKPDRGSAGAIDVVKVVMPQWPLLPKEPVGVGAKWQATSSQGLMGSNGIEMTQVTDYELIAKTGTTWTIKATTKITGKDQEVRGAKISGITGTGTSESKVVDGMLYPTMTSMLETTMTVPSEDGRPVQVTVKVGGTLTPKAL